MALGWLVCAFLGPFFLKWAFALGYVDSPGGRKLQSTPVAYGGGFLLAFGLLMWALLLGLAQLSGVLGWLFPNDELLLGALVFSSNSMAFALGFSGMLLLGFCDDLWSLSPRSKLFFQFICAFAVVLVGELRMTFFVESDVVNILGTVLWLVLISNAFNLIDNMDGYAAVVALVTLLCHAVLLSYHGQFLVAMATCMVMGPLLAFLRFNWPPAKMYLGDAGSLSLGFFVGMLSVASTYHREGDVWVLVLTPLVVLALPLFDVATVMWIRYREKRPFFVGDRCHFSHRLLALGLSERSALSVIAALCLVCACSAIAMQGRSLVVAFIVLFQVLALLFVVWVLERAPR